MSKDESEVESKIKSIKGILKIEQLNEEEKIEVMRLEGDAECHVMMGLCKGINIGVRKALEKRKVFACLTDNTMEWPRCSYIKLYAGNEVIGEEIVNPDQM